MLSDWFFNIAASLRVWAWAGTEPAKSPENQLLLPAAAAVLFFLSGFALLFWPRPSASGVSSRWISERRVLWIVMGTGLLLLVCSFPVYLVLDSARSLWRTQILSGLGAALIFASGVSLCAGYARRKWLSAGVIAVLSALIVGYGSYSAVKKSAYHHWIWERYRSVMAEVIHAAPRVKPGTL